MSGLSNQARLRSGFALVVIVPAWLAQRDWLAAYQRHRRGNRRGIGLVQRQHDRTVTAQLTCRGASDRTEAGELADPHEAGAVVDRAERAEQRRLGERVVEDVQHAGADRVIGGFVDDDKVRSPNPAAQLTVRAEHRRQEAGRCSSGGCDGAHVTTTVGLVRAWTPLTLTSASIADS